MTGNSRWRKALAVLVLLLLLAAFAAPQVWAFEGRAGDNVVIGADEVVDDDLYVAGSTVTINGTVRGDVVSAAQVIILNGTVEGGFIAVAQVVKLNGTVGHTARIAGQALMLGEKARMDGDCVAAGYSLEAVPGSNVKRDLLFAGYQTLLAGEVGRDLRAGSGGTRLAGKVGRDVQLEVGEPGEGGPPAMIFMPQLPGGVSIPAVPMGLTVADSAEIGGRLTYTSHAEGNIGPGARVAGGVTRQEPKVPEAEAKAPPSAGAMALDWFLNQLRRLVSLLLVGLLLVWVVPSRVAQAADTLQAKPLPSLGWGVVALIAFLVAVVTILIITIILAIIFGVITLGGLVQAVVGLGLLTNAALLAAFLLAVAYITKVIVSFLGGRWLLARVQPDRAAGRIWPLVVGVVIFVIITAIPILGQLISFVLTLCGLGALLLVAQSALRPAPPAEVPPPVA